MHKQNPPLAKLSALTLAGLLSACVTPGAKNALPTGLAVGDQDLSPFYAWTGGMPQKAGALLRTEPMPAQPEITAAASAKRILYTSTDARWRSGIVPVSGTLYLPKGEPLKGGWPLIAWAHGTLGVADRCAPSWAMHNPRDATYINRWLENGYAVVATDYQGLGGPGPHPYLNWEAEGRSVLDSIRAALAGSNGAIANEVIITGQSQGSGASLGASRIAPAYAPELRLRGTIATGVVTSFPDGPYKPALPVPGRGAPAYFAVLALLGGAIPDGGPTADELMSEKGRRLLQAGRDGCPDDMRRVAQREGLDVTNAFAVDYAKVQALVTPMTEMRSARMPAPLFLGTGLADRTVPPRRQYAAAMALCAAGNPLVWKTYEGSSHSGTVNTAFADELAFVRTVRAGKPAGNTCQSLVEPGPPGTPTPGIPFND